MTHDTDPTRGGGDTEPLADTSREVDAPADAATDPRSPPDADTAPDRPALAYGAEVADPEVAALLGKLAPARVPPAVGDTRETNGHAAAAFRVPLHFPPRAFDTPALAPAVVVEPSPVPVVASAGLPPMVVRAPGTMNLLTVPRARPGSPLAPKMIAGLAAGVLLTTLGVLAWLGTASRGSHPGSATASSSAVETATALAPGTAAAPATAADPPIAVALPASAAALPFPESPRRGSPPTSTRFAPVLSVASAAARPAGSPPPSPSSVPAVKPTHLPDDIKWTVE